MQTNVCKKGGGVKGQPILGACCSLSLSLCLKVCTRSPKSRKAGTRERERENTEAGSVCVCVRERGREQPLRIHGGLCNAAKKKGWQAGASVAARCAPSGAHM